MNRLSWTDNLANTDTSAVTNLSILNMVLRTERELHVSTPFEFLVVYTKYNKVIFDFNNTARLMRTLR